MPRHNELTVMEDRFVEEYVVDGNGARSARAAGYATKGANDMAYTLLRKPHVKVALAKALKEQQARTQITADAVLNRIKRIAEKAEGAGDYGPALRGQELLGKHLKLFTDKIEHGGIGGGPIVMHVTATDERL